MLFAGLYYSFFVYDSRLVPLSPVSPLIHSFSCPSLYPFIYWSIDWLSDWLIDWYFIILRINGVMELPGSLRRFSFGGPHHPPWYKHIFQDFNLNCLYRFIGRPLVLGALRSCSNPDHSPLRHCLESICSWKVLKLINQFRSIPDFGILLWLRPDNFTRQGETSWTGKD